MRKLYFLTLLLIGSVAFSFAQPNTGTLIDETHAVFKFRARDDMFYMKEIPENVQEFQRLHAFVNKYKSVIRNGENKVYVASYSTTIGAPRSDRALAKIMANRVKTELILQNGLKEEDFKTVNRPETYKDMNSAVVVEIWIRKKDVHPEPAPAPTPPPPPPAPAPKPEPTPEPAPTPTPAPAPVAKYSRWSIGLNAGLPFFNGDFNSITKNKVYIGWMVGLQGTYQISRTFGISLTADYAVNKTGSPKYGRNYLLSDAGDVYYVPQEGLNTRNWEELYSKISMFSAGLHVDVNVNRLFAPRRGPNKVNVILSPGAYMQTFNTKVRDKAYDDNFIGKSLSSGISFGLGGDAAMRVYLSPALDFQLKGTAIWMHENLFDNIRNLKAKDNLFWSTSIGLIWKINGSNNSDNLLYKPKQ